MEAYLSEIEETMKPCVEEISSQKPFRWMTRHEAI